MSDRTLDLQIPRYAFVVYAPPAQGIPWLSVCIGPDGRVYAAQAFDSQESAERQTSECARQFIEKLRFDSNTMSMRGFRAMN